MLPEIEAYYVVMNDAAGLLAEPETFTVGHVSDEELTQWFAEKLSRVQLARQAIKVYADNRAAALEGLKASEDKFVAWFAASRWITSHGWEAEQILKAWPMTGAELQAFARNAGWGQTYLFEQFMDEAKAADVLA